MVVPPDTLPPAEVGSTVTFRDVEGGEEVHPAVAVSVKVAVPL